MRYRHKLIDKGDLLKEIDTTFNSHNVDKNSVLWVRNIICRAEEKENRGETTASIVVEFNPMIGGVITYKCSNCGEDINIMDKFCRNCGCQFVSTEEKILHDPSN